MDRLWDGLNKERRNNIRKALKLGLTVRECGSEQVFLAARKTFERQGKQVPYSFDYLARLYEAARANDAGVCMAVEDPDGNLHAASFFVWDCQRGYHLAGGHDPAFSSSGGAVLLVWKMIEFAATHTAAFDFEGSMVKQVESSYRSFGGKRIAYNRIVKMPRWLRICLLAAGKLQV
jgi:lipid II:glycine glycyltransferase (peptidoglycan interpeptide bridge formation enzyme)